MSRHDYRHLVEYIAGFHTDPDNACINLYIKDAMIEVQAADELTDLQPGRHRARWERIKAIRAQIDAGWKNDPTMLGRVKKGVVPWHETALYARLVREYSWLVDIEREMACQLGFPVHQERQTFYYRAADGTIREGHTLSFDLEAGTVTATTHAPYDLYGPSSLEDITVEQIEAGERARLEEDAERHRAQAGRYLREHPQMSLFGEGA
jgi:hypothetical protein